MTVCEDSSHSCGRLLKNECRRATILPAIKAAQTYNVSAKQQQHKKLMLS
jgi:hypothetical protein